MKRREFMQWMGVGMVASSLPVAIAACQSDPGSSTNQGVDPAAGAGTQEFVMVGTVADLEATGSLTNRSLQGNPVVVIRDPANSEQLRAVNARCTHSGCTVAWQGDRNRFICPCHGAQYAPDGTVISGPAPQALGTYAAKIDRDQVLVGL
ncbi:MAG TPA: ubiquinol-cytochrome c reductase iron-sulfur subunit [Leptolyngbyaceae cyanobacterium M65_K2018_010]|nr:ubiquinol-cytochrome c reductase iron-sulfur subunit [Leptolyngbyaceae cyanobacterium M65_K2018_010]